jgi:hypothetical protein
MPTLLLHDGDTISVDHGSLDMQRLKNAEPGRPPHHGANWLAGMMIGSTIMTMAAQAMLAGATAAINNVTLKGNQGNAGR